MSTDYERATDESAHGIPRPHVLREYALIADGERGALIGPRGEFVWMCFPHWHSDATFSSLIGGAGNYAITPDDRFVWGGYYEPGSLIWCSRWIGDKGVVECREALALPSSPTRAVILRRVVARQGNATVRVVLNPRGAFGDAPLRAVRVDDDGVWHGRIGDCFMQWSGGAKAEVGPDGHGGKTLTLMLSLAEGEHHDFVLTLDQADSEPPPDPERAWQGTEQDWRDRVPEIDCSALAQRDAHHAYAVLSGLTSHGGGMVAAATTSLPERASEGRNYDYRYVWIRDQCYVGSAVAGSGAHSLLDDAVRFVGARLLDDGSQLKPAYTVDGGRVPDQHDLDLPGYPGGSDRIGNWVNKQFQLDSFGEALLLFAAAAEHDHLDADGWRAAEAAASAIEQRWHEPDAGIWEIEPAHWTHSRLICAAGLRAISGKGPGGEQAAQWLSLADAIVAKSAATAMHPSGRWQRATDDPRVDAALLLPAIRGAIPPEDPRSVATLEAVARELTDGGYCYRYRPDERPLGQSEGTFLLCGFWMALAWQAQGNHIEAVRWFERNRAACGPPGIFSEEFDVNQRQMRGNLPQAFVHALMLECAVAQREF